MYKNLRWKALATVVVTGLAVWSFMPPSTKVKLGLDLKGGVHLVMKVKTDEALKAETETTSGQFQEALRTAPIPVSSVRVAGLTEFTVEGVPSDRDQQFRQLADTQLGTTFDRETGVGGTYTFRMKPNVQRTTREDAVTQALQTIERRVNEFGVSEPIVAPYGTTGDQIIVQLPGVTDITRAKELIRQTAQLHIKLVEGGPASDEKSLLTAHNGVLPPDLEVVPGVSGVRGDTTRLFYLVRRVSAITGADLRNAKPTIDELNLPAVSFTLEQRGRGQVHARDRSEHRQAARDHPRQLRAVGAGHRDADRAG